MIKKILIADDEYDIRYMLEQVLKLEGFEVKGVSNGREALDAIAKESFDLLILDLMMPEIDGYGVMKGLAPSVLKRMKVVILSAKSTDEEKVLGYTIGITQYVTKPFDNEILVDIVKSILNDK